jgi:hypothetical protein
MEKEEIIAIVDKYRKMSHNYSFYGEDKCYEFEQIAEIIEDNLDGIIEEDYSTEEDVVAFAKETLSLGQDHYEREDYINMGLLDEPYEE